MPDDRRHPSPRLIAGLLYLQHAFDLSDEEVVWQWVENPYWQVFTGETFLQTEPPIDPSSLTRWRMRLGEAGVEVDGQTHYCHIDWQDCPNGFHDARAIFFVRLRGKALQALLPQYFRDLDVIFADSPIKPA